MTEDHRYPLTPNGHRNSKPQGGSDGDLTLEDQSMVQMLQQAAAMRYPVPDPEVTWQRIMARQAPSNVRAVNKRGHQRDRTLPPLVSSGAPHLPAMPKPQALPAPPLHVQWRPVLAVLALSAVVGLGLLGSLRGVLEWSWPLAQRGMILPMQEAASSDQVVLALDPADLQAQLGPGWSIEGSQAGVADVEAPAITGFLGSTRLQFGGPNGARLTLVIMPLAADASAISKAWSWTREDLADIVQYAMDPNSSTLAYGPEDTTVPGCAQAIHREGDGKVDWMYLVGVTLCQVDTQEMVLVTTSGEILGNEGSAASDQMASFIAKHLVSSPIVPTHHYDGIDTGDGLSRDPSPDAPVVEPLPRGAPLRWTGELERTVNGDVETYWLQMQTADGTEGWVPGTSLVPTPQSAEDPIGT